MISRPRWPGRLVHAPMGNIFFSFVFLDINGCSGKNSICLSIYIYTDNIYKMYRLFLYWTKYFGLNTTYARSFIPFAVGSVLRCSTEYSEFRSLSFSDVKIAIPVIDVIDICSRQLRLRKMKRNIRQKRMCPKAPTCGLVSGRYVDSNSTACAAFEPFERSGGFCFVFI